MPDQHQAEVRTENYVGAVGDVVDLEFEDFAYDLYLRLSGDTGLSRDEFHDIYFLQGGWGDAREFLLGVYKSCGLAAAAQAVEQESESSITRADYLTYQKVRRYYARLDVLRVCNDREYFLSDELRERIVDRYDKYQGDNPHWYPALMGFIEDAIGDGTGSRLSAMASEFPACCSSTISTTTDSTFKRLPSPYPTPQHRPSASISWNPCSTITACTNRATKLFSERWCSSPSTRAGSSRLPTGNGAIHSN